MTSNSHGIEASKCVGRCVVLSTVEISLMSALSMCVMGSMTTHFKDLEALYFMVKITVWL